MTNITELKLKNQNVEIWKEYFLTYNSTAYLNNEHILVFLSRAHRYLYLVSSVIKILAHHLHGYYFLLWCYFLCEILNMLSTTKYNMLQTTKKTMLKNTK